MTVGVNTISETFSDAFNRMKLYILNKFLKIIHAKVFKRGTLCAVRARGEHYLYTAKNTPKSVSLSTTYWGLLLLIKGLHSSANVAVSDADTHWHRREA
jgi:hypothetical protein